MHFTVLSFALGFLSLLFPFQLPTSCRIFLWYVLVCLFQKRGVISFRLACHVVVAVVLSWPFPFVMWVHLKLEKHHSLAENVTLQTFMEKERKSWVVDGQISPFASAGPSELKRSIYLITGISKHAPLHPHLLGFFLRRWVPRKRWSWDHQESTLENLELLEFLAQCRWCA